MRQLLAIDWDESEVRYVLGRVTAGRLRVTAAGSGPIHRDDSSSEPGVGQAVRESLSGQRLGRRTVLVALSRGDVEFLPLSLPPAKDAELPDLVAHEILRKSPQVNEYASVDFIPLDGNPAEPRRVNAAVCAADHIERITRCCREAGLHAHRLVIRPYALLALRPTAGDETQHCSLLVCRVGDEIDLAVVVQQRVLYARTAKLPKWVDEESHRERLLAEINRTLLAAPSSEGGGAAVEHVYVFGQGELQQWIVDKVRSDFGLQATTVDPFASATMALDVIPGRTDRFAPLVGMLHDEARKSHALDFLHPRKPPAPPNRRRQLTLLAGALAVVLTGVGLHFWDSLQALEADNAKLEQRLRELDKSLKKANGQRRVTEAVEQWQLASTNWLDELRDFSLRFPSSRDAVVLHLALLSRENGGEMDFSALVRDPTILYRMENSVRDAFHQVRSKGIQERDQEKTYSWHFESRIAVKPRSKSEYAAHFHSESSPSSGVVTTAQPAKPVPVAAVSNATGAGTRASAGEAPKRE
jgi:Tfp pilus assembly protein PilN